jgi:5-methylcytosine-specific restriction endonuclease McrA
MPWDTSPEKRKRDKETYGDPEYQRNRKLALKRANGRCERCGRRAARLQVDHRIPRSQGGGHGLGNLQVLCSGPQSCHAKKSAAEGGLKGRPGDDPYPRTGTQW